MHEPFIRLTSKSGLTLSLFTLFCSASLWLLLLLPDHRPLVAAAQTTHHPTFTAATKASSPFAYHGLIEQINVAQQQLVVMTDLPAHQRNTLTVSPQTLILVPTSPTSGKVGTTTLEHLQVGQAVLFNGQPREDTTIQASIITVPVNPISSLTPTP